MLDGVIVGLWKVAGTAMAIGMVLIATLAAMPVIKVSARADILDHLNRMYNAPNSFEPSGFNANGTATWLDVQLSGGSRHNSFAGNVGIGNGSVATFGDKNSLPANQSDPYFIGADVSQQPIDPIRELNLNVVSPVSGGNNSSQNDHTTAVNTSASEETATNATATNLTTSSEPTPPALTPENMTYNAYHPITFGAPANDLLYEHPQATSVSAYCRLIGLETPSGVPVNVAMKCLGYGY